MTPGGERAGDSFASHPHEHHSMPRDDRGERIVMKAEIALLPEIANHLIAAKSEIRPAHRHRPRDEITVEQPHGHRAIREFPRPHLRTAITKRAPGSSA